ncbi:hypothetical protein OIU78_006792 [Salix suchowensis]|nr:hypothetical protein OIU78_006792 [Salix suchowensis]
MWIHLQYILSLVKFIHAGASTGVLSRNTIFRLQVERITTHDVNETGCSFTHFLTRSPAKSFVSRRISNTLLPVFYPLYLCKLYVDKGHKVNDQGRSGCV